MNQNRRGGGGGSGNRRHPDDRRSRYARDSSSSAPVTVIQRSGSREEGREKTRSSYKSPHPSNEEETAGRKSRGSASTDPDRELRRILAGPEPLLRSVNIINTRSNWIDQGYEFLSDSGNFLVVSCIGLQGTGKSTIMNYLADESFFRRDTEGAGGTKRQTAFRMERREELECAGHCTTGVKMALTKERIILLDSQPLLSVAGFQHLEYEDRSDTLSDMRPEDVIDRTSLELLAFLLAISHVVLVVVDDFVDHSLLRLLAMADVLRPSISSGEYPVVVFVNNKAPAPEFRPHVIGKRMNFLGKAFSHSSFNMYAGINSYSQFSSTLSPELASLNYFPLPDFYEKDPQKLLVTGDDHVKHFCELKSSILSIPRRNLYAGGSLSEQQWYVYASKMWQSILKYPAITEYLGTLP